MNKVILVGRLTKDPDARQVGESTVARFTLAVDRRFKDKDGNKVTDFFPIQYWGKTAEIAHRYLHKGDMCGVVGQLQTRSYNTQDGSTRYVTEIQGDELMLMPRSGGQSASEPSSGGFVETDEELPF